MNNNKEWFADWFDSPYYHILYKDRNDKEAELFLNNIVSFLSIPSHASIIDLACGKGRHSVFLNKAGFNVTGVDLSENSIAFANQFANETLNFKVADLRTFESKTHFDYAFNLFTSFAYFKSDEENKQVLNCFKKCLNPSGTLVLDFFNAEKLMQHKSLCETKTIEGITFNINKFIENKKIIKRIEFKADGHNYYFQEEVQLLNLADFKELFAKTGFEILHVFGDYQLNNFEETESDRLIFIAKT